MKCLLDSLLGYDLVVFRRFLLSFRKVVFNQIFFSVI